jgi:hypothetical protein
VRGSIRRPWLVALLVALAVGTLIAAGGCLDDAGHDSATGNGATANGVSACDLFTKDMVTAEFGTSRDFIETREPGGTDCSRSVSPGGQRQGEIQGYVVDLSLHHAASAKAAATRVRADKASAQVPPLPIPEVAHDAWWDDGLGELHWSDGERWFVLVASTPRSPQRRRQLVAIARSIARG